MDRSIDTIKQLFELLRAGLWEQDVERRNYETMDFPEILRLATEQSVVGLIAAGLEHVKGVKVPQEWSLQFIGQTLQIEQRNKAMNAFIAELIDGLRKVGVYTLLVKGQGVAQCYERPLWRASGDVDLLLSDSKYNQAKEYLSTIADSVDKEDERRLHLGMNVKGWVVELHGSLLTGISRQLNNVIEEVQYALFNGGEVRSWDNENTVVYLPSPDDDAFLIFSHILEHFYVGGIGLRQVCDWCRLLWTYREMIDVRLIERRLRKAKILTEWKGFAAFSVDYLGMPVEVMPLYEDKKKWHRCAVRLCNRIIETGNFGHNADESYRRRTSKAVRLMITFWRRVAEYWKLTMIFPTQTPRIFLTYVTGRVRANM